MKTPHSGEQANQEKLSPNESYDLNFKKRVQFKDQEGGKLC
jgi:hypothetical protein